MAGNWFIEIVGVIELIDNRISMHIYAYICVSRSHILFYHQTVFLCEQIKSFFIDLLMYLSHQQMAAYFIQLISLDFLCVSHFYGNIVPYL